MSEDPQQGMCNRMAWLAFGASQQLLLFRLELLEAQPLLGSGQSSLMQQFGLSFWQLGRMVLPNLAFHLPVRHFVPRMFHGILLVEADGVRGMD